MKANELIQWLRAEAQEGDRVVVSDCGEFLYLMPEDPSRSSGAGVYLGGDGEDD